MYDVIVVGGGIAGCSCAAHLACAGKRVLLLERRSYPAHKICGEFLSVEVSAKLARLEVLDTVLEAGASPITSVLVTTESGQCWQGPLPGIAYGFSRFELDRILFERALSTGVDARNGETVSSISGNLGSGFSVQSSSGTYESTMVIGSFGKNSRLAHSSRRMRGPGQEFVGFKEHFRGAGPTGTVEVHTFDRGYCGINRIEDGKVNVCWLAHRSLLIEMGGNHETVVEHALRRNPYLNDRLKGLFPMPGTLCAASGISLSDRGRFFNDICLIGDSSQMIAPFCGDGMGMALRTAEIAAPLCVQFLEDRISRNTFMQNYTKEWNFEFRRRILLGQVVQSTALAQPAAEAALRLLGLVPSLGAWLIRQTRDSRCSYPPAELPNSSKQPSIVKPGPNASPNPNR